MNLYKEKFDPLLISEEIPERAPVQGLIMRHCREIAEAQGIVVVHPNWWGQPPAILKGWIDRVLRAGVAYEFVEGDSRKGIPNGLLKAGTAMVFNTSNTENEDELGTVDLCITMVSARFVLCIPGPKTLPAVRTQEHILLDPGLADHLEYINLAHLRV